METIFRATGWQFYTDILQGVDIPAGKKLSEKGEFRIIVHEDFFVAIWRETPKYDSKHFSYFRECDFSLKLFFCFVLFFVLLLLLLFVLFWFFA